MKIEAVKKDDLLTSYLAVNYEGCGRCIEACPSGLNPHKLYQCITTNHSQKAISLGLHSCIGCSSCSYICPSRLDLAHTIIGAKDRLTGESKQ